MLCSSFGLHNSMKDALQARCKKIQYCFGEEEEVLKQGKQKKTLFQLDQSAGVWTTIDKKLGFGFFADCSFSCSSHKQFQVSIKNSAISNRPGEAGLRWPRGSDLSNRQNPTRKWFFRFDHAWRPQDGVTGLSIVLPKHSTRM